MVPHKEGHLDKLRVMEGNTFGSSDFAVSLKPFLI